MKTAYFDCFSGASGDMILGALVSAGWPVEALEATLGKLGAVNYRIVVSDVRRSGFAATQVSFELPDQPDHRPLGDLFEMISSSPLPDAIRAGSLRVLERLGEAEAKVHGLTTPLTELRLHELGSLDTVFDVVGSVAGLGALGVSAIHVSPINLGGGAVRTAHGLLPVPAPAVAELVRGLPVYGGSTPDGELLTPTAAALLGILGSSFGPLPRMTVERLGVGAGRREREVPNVLRLWIGEVAGVDEADEVELLEANIDDMNPELYGVVLDRLMAEGALDVYLTPVIMKKGRPAIVLGVLCPPERSSHLEDIIFEESTTLGVRRARMARRTLERQEVTVATAYGEVRVKVGRHAGRVVTVAPEFEDCRRAALAGKVPAKVVYEVALAAFRERR